jgi:flagellar basal-body rod protein FlgG
MRALDIAASGMAAQDLNVQVISNNIANMNTTGYKRQRAEFQDLLYEHVSRVGTQTSAQGNILPVGIDLGGGVKTVGTPRLITQGSLSQTGNTLDVAVIGDGFFKILMPDGSFSYTRDGSFKMDAQGRVVTPEGNVVHASSTRPVCSRSATTCSSKRRHRGRRRTDWPASTAMARSSRAAWKPPMSIRSRKFPT